RKFWDDAAGTFSSAEGRVPPAASESRQRPLPAPAFAGNARSAEDGATPSGQAMAALALLRLEQLTGNRALRSRARRVIDAYAAGMKRSPAAFPTLLLAAELYFAETPRPVVADPVRLTVT